MMKYSILLFIILSVFFCQCTTDFEIEATGKDLPIVYGLIDVQDTAHYIRVERAFLSGGEDAAIIAQRPDSLYYGPSVSIRLENTGEGQTFDLERVDGNLEGYPKQDGPFASDPNILYKIKAEEIDLRGGEVLQLIIDRGEGKPLVTAETTVLSPMVLVDNLPPNPWSLGNYLSSRRIAWRTAAEAQIFDVRMLIHIRESSQADPNVLEDRTLEWVLTKSFKREDNNIQVNYSFLVEELFLFLSGSLEPLSAGRREFKDLDIVVRGGGSEFSDLITISQANVGITSGSDEIPVFSNLSEGRGIFSSRTGDLRKDIQLTSVSLDSLSNGIYTGDLGFQ